MTQVKINVRSNVKQARAKLKHDRRAVDTAAARAINRTLTMMVTEFSRQIRGRYTVKAKSTKRRIKVTRRARHNSLIGIVQAEGRPLALLDFSARVGKRGVTVKIKKGGTRRRIPGAFRIERAVPLVVARGRYRNNEFRFQTARLPVTKLVGPGVPQMFEDADIQAHMGRFGQRVFARRFDHELRRLVGQRI